MADTNGADYEYQNYSYSFNSVNQTKELIIRSIDDNLVEADETYTLIVKLKPPYPQHVKIGENGTTTITIYNDDGKCRYIYIYKN